MRRSWLALVLSLSVALPAAARASYEDVAWNTKRDAVEKRFPGGAGSPDEDGSTFYAVARPQGGQQVVLVFHFDAKEQLNGVLTVYVSPDAPVSLEQLKGDAVKPMKKDQAQALVGELRARFSKAHGESKHRGEMEYWKSGDDVVALGAMPQGEGAVVSVAYFPAAEWKE